MKTFVITSTLLFSLASTGALAHHPAEEMVDPDIYAMIDENVADTPHADLTFDDMGGDLEAAEEAIDDRGMVDLADNDVEVEMTEMRMGRR